MEIHENASLFPDLFPESTPAAESTSSAPEHPSDAAPASTGQKGKKDRTKNPAAAPTPPKERVVFYAGHRFDIPDPALSLEDIRKLLEVQFPELAASRTTMVTDPQTGHIVPVVTAAKKGGR